MAYKHRPLTVNKQVDATLTALLDAGNPPPNARATLGSLLQSAIRLEFATIPPYLAAAYSLGTNNERIRHLLLRVAREEMLHMTAVANIMNAIGVSPNIAGAVPTYPFDLDLLDPPLRLDLNSFSLGLVEELLMRIEVPEDPVEYPRRPPVGIVEAARKPRTIGQFYASIIDIIQSDAITGLFENAEQDAYKQIQIDPRFEGFAYTNNKDSQKYPLKAGIDFLIRDKATAVRHLEWIVDQGEGAEPLDPLTAEGIPGHYYRLESILRSRYLVPDLREPELRHSFSGADLPFDAAAVHTFDTNPRLADYAALTRVPRQLKRFNASYTSMINALQAAFTCPAPERREDAIAAYTIAIARMRDMPNIATAIVQSAQTEGVKAGLPFEYGGPADF